MEPNSVAVNPISLTRRARCAIKLVFVLPLLLILSSRECHAMLRLALRQAAAATSARARTTPRHTIAVVRSRAFGTGSSDAAQHERVALQRTQYALAHARSQRSDESYGQAMLVLEQGVSNLRGMGTESSDEATGMLLLAMSTLLYERGELHDAMDKLHMVHRLDRTSSALRVAAWEGLVGLSLEAGKDVVSSVFVDDCFQFLKSRLESGVPASEVTNSRAKAIKGLVNLVLGDQKSAKSSFDGCNDYSLKEVKGQAGNVALSYGEVFHAIGDFSLARDFYEKALQVSKENDIFDSPYLVAANMVSEEVLVGATCALGQLLSHSGQFSDAEELLTKALTKAEEHFGSTHPKVAVILTCIAMMYGRKARLEASSSLLIQEGLYRKVLDLLKAPSLDCEATLVNWRDIVALARGGYAEILCIQQNRKDEGERMKRWAKAAWRNQRLSLAQALEFSEPPRAAVVDTRISRVL